MIESADHPDLDLLCHAIRECGADTWPQESLERCGQAGFYRWFVPVELGGLGWSATEIAKGYLKLSAADLTTTFILTQRVAALRRIVGGENPAIKANLLPQMLDGSKTATVGISHLTTSRQHTSRPVMRATGNDDGFEINGNVPWVTGGAEVDFVLMGASVVGPGEVATGQQILFLASPKEQGVGVQKPFDLMALSSSHTGAVSCDRLKVAHENVIAGPKENVLLTNGGGAGSLQTSVLAIGLASAAIDFIESESRKRGDLVIPQTSLRGQLQQITAAFFAATDGSEKVTAAEIRTRANSLAIRATQAALVAAKGAGFVSGHPVGRWCQEALFFLVWSCPQAVATANLHEFAVCQ